MLAQTMIFTTANKVTPCDEKCNASAFPLPRLVPVIKMVVFMKVYIWVNLFKINQKQYQKHTADHFI